MAQNMKRRQKPASYPWEEDLLDRARMLQAMSPSEITHRIGHRCICSDAILVQAQERKCFAQNRRDDRIARENRAPSLGDLVSRVRN